MRTFRIGRILGVDVIGDSSLVALGLLLTWVIYLELRLPEVGASPTAALAAAIGSGLVFLGTVLVHEVSHTAMAQRRGMAVTRIRLMIFGGASELQEDSMSPETELAVAIVGPVVSAILGVLFLLLAAISESSAAISNGLRFVGLANIALAVFNLLPGLPLDGGRVLRSILWRRTGDRDRATRMALQAGRLVGLGLIVFGVVLLLRGATGVLGLWIAFVGWFLTRMAAGSARHYRLEVATRGRSVGDLMRPVFEAVPVDATVATAVDLYQVGPRMRTQVVESAGRVVGLLGQVEVDGVDPTQRESTPVSSIMKPIGPADVIDSATPLREAMQQPAGVTHHIVVTSNNRVVGLVGAQEVADLLREANPG